MREHDEQTARELLKIYADLLKITDHLELVEAWNQADDVWEGLGRLSNDLYDAYDELRAKIKARRLELMREKIEQQARDGHGFITLEVKFATGVERLQVALAPFTLWALRGVDMKKYGLPELSWDLVSRSGMKMLYDDPLHTDWVIGAGIGLGHDPDGIYCWEKGTRGAAINAAAYEKAEQLVREVTGRSINVLSSGKYRYVTGLVCHPKPGETVPPNCIAIVPSASPNYQRVLERTARKGALVCEVGGKLAHLPTVGRELGATIVQVTDALALYPAGRWVEIDLDAGTIALRP